MREKEIKYDFASTLQSEVKEAEKGRESCGAPTERIENERYSHSHCEDLPRSRENTRKYIGKL